MTSTKSKYSCVELSDAVVVKNIETGEVLANVTPTGVMTQGILQIKSNHISGITQAVGVETHSMPTWSKIQETISSLPTVTMLSNATYTSGGGTVFEGLQLTPTTAARPGLFQVNNQAQTHNAMLTVSNAGALNVLTSGNYIGTDSRVELNNTTDATSTTSVALYDHGGLAVGRDVTVNETITVRGIDNAPPAPDPTERKPGLVSHTGVQVGPYNEPGVGWDATWIGKAASATYEGTVRYLPTDATGNQSKLQLCTKDKNTGLYAWNDVFTQLGPVSTSSVTLLRSPTDSTLSGVFYPDYKATAPFTYYGVAVKPSIVSASDFKLTVFQDTAGTIGGGITVNSSGDITMNCTGTNFTTGEIFNSTNSADVDKVLYTASGGCRVSGGLHVAKSAVVMDNITTLGTQTGTRIPGLVSFTGAQVQPLNDAGTWDAAWLAAVPSLDLEGTVRYMPHDATSAPSTLQVCFFDNDTSAYTWEHCCPARGFTNEIQLLSGVRSTGAGGATQTAVGNFQFWTFAGNADNDLFMQIDMPHNWKKESDLEIHIHWITEDNTAGNIDWSLTYNVGAFAGAFDTTGTTATTRSIANSATTYYHQMTTVATIGMLGVTADGACVLLRLRRLGSTDTYNKLAYLVSGGCHYTSNRFGS